ncbi:MAG: hypothetical protein CME06_17310 [Gemmatimonadetes bacterium]|nr:hypothetical protein [Gemmatimonadota bacterium]
MGLAETIKGTGGERHERVARAGSMRSRLRDRAARPAGEIDANRMSAPMARIHRFHFDSATLF